MEQELPPVREIILSQFHNLGPPPSLVIKTDEDVERWKNTRSYNDYDLFLRRLNESVIGVNLPWTAEITSQVKYKQFLLFFPLTGCI